MRDGEKEGKRKGKTWICLYAEESKNRCSERPHNPVLLRHPHHISSFYTMPYVHQSHLTRKSQTFFPHCYGFINLIRILSPSRWGGEEFGHQPTASFSVICINLGLFTPGKYFTSYGFSLENNFNKRIA